MHVKSLYLLFFLFPFYSFSQVGSLKVIVKDDNSNEPIIGASVSLLTPTVGAYLRGGQTQADGRALIEDIPSGKYTLKISYIGMADYTREGIQIEANKTLDMAIITLTPVGEQLSEVVVQGRIPELQLGIDKKVFDVSQSTISAGGTAEEQLRHEERRKETEK